MSAGIRADVPIIGDLSQTETGQMLRGIANVMLTATQLAFHASSDPHGRKWPELSPETIRKRRKGSDKPLIDTGILRNSYMVSEPFADIAGMSIEMGSDMEYAAIHNFGGMAGRGRKTKVPQRQYIPDPDDLPADLQEEIMDLGAIAVMNGVSNANR